MGTQLTHMSEDYTISRPPLFVGTNYTHWRRRMEVYIQGVDYELWEIVTQGPHVPKREVISKDGIRRYIAKIEEEFGEEDYEILTKNARALNVLICGLEETEFSRVSQYTSAHEVWRSLELTYEEKSIRRMTDIDSLTVHELICNPCMEELTIEQKGLRGEQEREDERSLIYLEDEDNNNDDLENNPFIKNFLEFKELFGNLCQDISNDEVESLKDEKLHHLKIDDPTLAYLEEKSLILENCCQGNLIEEEKEEDDDLKDILCLMANENEEVSSNSSFSLDHDDISLHDIQMAFCSLNDEFSKLRKVEKNLVRSDSLTIDAKGAGIAAADIGFPATSAGAPRISRPASLLLAGTKGEVMENAASSSPGMAMDWKTTGWSWAGWAGSRGTRHRSEPL